VAGAAAAHFLIGGIFLRAAGISGSDRKDTIELVERRLHAPETPAGKGHLSRLRLGLILSGVRGAGRQQKERAERKN
jgi:hypothetical protein